MTISSSNVAPDFSWRQKLVAEDLRHLDAPSVIFEHESVDPDGAQFFVYTVGGWLNGARLRDGCTVGGEVMIVNASNREDADAMASMGLHDTILALDDEKVHYQKAAAALARLDSVGAAERLEQALKPDTDKSEAFIEDVKKIRVLVGDDIILSAGEVSK